MVTNLISQLVESFPLRRVAVFFQISFKNYVCEDVMSSFAFPGVHKYSALFIIHEN